MTYLIDTENIGTHWLEFLPKACDTDMFVFYYTANTMSYTMDAIAKLTASRCFIDFVPCDTGHNSLDFHLIADLALRAAHDPEEEYTVVTWDTGFDSALKYMTGMGFRVRREAPGTVAPKPAPKPAAVPAAKPAAPAISSKALQKAAKKAAREKLEKEKDTALKNALMADRSKKASYIDRIRVVRPDADEDTADKIASILLASETRPKGGTDNRKNYVHSMLCKHFKQKIATKWYAAVKGFVKT